MPAKNVKIDVNVNVEKLYNGGTIDECCSLSDDNGGKTPTGNPEQFKTMVYKAKKVTWEPEKTGENASNYNLSLLSIDYESDCNLFGDDSLPAQRDGSVRGEVLSTVNVGDCEKYMIKFTISTATGAVKTFAIDPDLETQDDGEGDG